MSRAEIEADIRETLGIVPGFFGGLPDYLLESEWTSFKSLELGETAIPNKYKELIGLGISAATRCKYCAYFHTEAAARSRAAAGNGLDRVRSRRAAETGEGRVVVARIARSKATSS